MELNIFSGSSICNKLLFLVCSMLLSLSVFAQQKPLLLQGQVLRDSLHGLIQPIKVLKYGGGNGRTWDGFGHTDRMENDEVRDRYSNEVRFLNDNNAAVSNMNIEHIWANSWWGHVQNFAYKDLFNLYPADATANGRKSNNPIGVVDGAVSYDNGVVKIGKSSSYSPDSQITAWEPADQWKGDFARTYFYMAICYSHMTDLWTTTEGLLTVDPKSPLVMRPWVYNLMMQWAKDDPVDDIERVRCDSIERIQGNRNPFVDVPVLCEYIWGDSIALAFDINRVIEKKDATLHIEPDPDPSTQAVFSVSPTVFHMSAVPGQPSNMSVASVYMQKVEISQFTAVTAAPFELSEDGEAWTHELTLTGNSRSFMIRFAGTEEEGEYDGEVVVSTQGVDDRIVELHCSVDAGKVFFENFETGSKGAYALAEVKCQAATWEMSNALIAGDENARDGKCVRMKGYVKSGTTITTPAHVMMTTDKENGCDSLWFYAGSYGTDTGVKMTVSYSLDGGQHWLPIAKELPIGKMQRYAFKLNQQGKVRLKFESENTGNKRVNIDDVQMTDWTDPDGIKSPESDSSVLGAGYYSVDGIPTSAGMPRRGIVIGHGKKQLR